MTRLGLLASEFECASALGGRKRATAGTFSRWSEGWWRRARPWHRGTYAGTGRHGRQRHCLYGAPIARSQVLQTLQALWRTFIAHVEPQWLMGLAVVHNRLFIAIEGQCTQLMGDLFRERERERRRSGWRGLRCGRWHMGRIVQEWWQYSRAEREQNRETKREG